MSGGSTEAREARKNNKPAIDISSNITEDKIHQGGRNQPLSEQDEREISSALPVLQEEDTVPDVQKAVEKKEKIKKIR